MSDKHVFGEAVFARHTDNSVDLTQALNTGRCSAILYGAWHSLRSANALAVRAAEAGIWFALLG